RQGRHQLDLGKAFGRRRFLGRAKDQTPDSAADEIRVGVHGADAGGLARGVEQPRLAINLAGVAAIKCRAPAPSATPRDRSVAALDDEVGAVLYQLAVEA